MKTNKQDLITDIKTRTSFCIGDANTYLWAKCQPDFQNAQHVGGGNFTVLLISFSVLDLLSYVNGLLNNVLTYSDQDVKDFTEKLKVAEIKNIRPPKKDDIKQTAKELVKTLIKETNTLTSIDEDDVDLLWSIRHKITHEFNPKLLPAGSVPLMPNQDFRELKQSIEKQPIIVKGEGYQDCIHVHSLNYKIQILSDHVVSKIENANEDTIEKIVEWLK